MHSARGFQYKPERPGAPDVIAQKWGWSGSTPGDWAELALDTRAPSSPANASVVVWLAHLQSYEVGG